MTVVLPSSVTVVLPSTISGLLLLILGYAVFRTDSFEKIVGWMWLGLSSIYRGADRNAVRLRVQGEVNTALNDALAAAPSELREGKLKIKWVAPEEVQTIISGGDVVVCLQRSRFHEENVANAVMAYLPKAIVPRARRYMAIKTMQSVDLVLAKAVVGRVKTSGGGTMQAFLERHLDPALAHDEVLRKKVKRTNAIDITGWLTRIFLDEIKFFGDRLYPGESSYTYIQEADGFHSWLYGLAIRPRGLDIQLWFRGDLIRVGMIMVARKVVLTEQGIRPYLRWIDRYAEGMKMDSIYIIASDSTIPYAKRLIKYGSLTERIDSVAEYEYRPRPEFRSRVPVRKHVFCAVLRYRPLEVVAEEMDEHEITGEDLQTLIESLDEVAPESDVTAEELEVEQI